MIKRILLLLTLFCVFKTSNASYIVGGSIQYKPLGGLLYQIELKLVRDCRSIGMQSNQTITVYNDSFSINRTVKRDRIEVFKEDTCKSGCSNLNQSSGMGFENQYFLDTIDFSQSPYNRFGTSNYPLVYFGFSQCCRNNASILTYSGGNFFVNSMLNLSFLKSQNETITSTNPYKNFPIYLNLANTFNYSLATKKPSNIDSISYELDRPMTASNSYATYTGSYPLSVYCVKPNITSCNPNPNLSLAVGFYFDESTGNLIFTPTYGGELGAFVFKTNYYKKVNNQMVLVGFDKYDITYMIIINTANNMPYCKNNKDIVLKARDSFCQEFKIEDAKTSTQSSNDSNYIQIHSYPKVGTLSLLDSNARLKTLRYCWRATDQDYIDKKTDGFVFSAIEKRCDLFSNPTITKSVKVSVTAPDSVFLLKVNTFFDRNKNGAKDIDEKWIHTDFFVKNSNDFNLYKTNTDGRLKLSFFKGNYTIGIPQTGLYYPTNSDFTFYGDFDSVVNVELGVYYRTGVTARLFDDANLNCTYDVGEKWLDNVAFNDSITKNVFLTNNSGQLTFLMDSGSFNLKPRDDYYLYKCQIPVGQLIKDSIIDLGNIPVVKNNDFNDLRVHIRSKNYQKNNSKAIHDIVIVNKGNKSYTNLNVRLTHDFKFYNFSSTTAHTVQNGFIDFTLPAINANEFRVIEFSHFLMKDTVYKDGTVCFKAEIQSFDDDLNNNTYSLCEKIYDSGVFPTEKTILSNPVITQLNTKVTYKIQFNGFVNGDKLVLITDTLDKDVFDINSFQLIENPQLLQIQLIDNVVHAQFRSGSLSSQSLLGFVYSVNVKKEIKDVFKITNQAQALVNNHKQILTNLKETQTHSVIKVTGFNKSTICKSEPIDLIFDRTYLPDVNNRYKFYISDSNGDFDNETLLLDTALSYIYKTIRLSLPSQYNNGKFRIRMEGTNPKVSSFESENTSELTVNPLPNVQLTSSFTNGYVCQNDSVKLVADNGFLNYQFYQDQAQLSGIVTNNQWRFLPYRSGQLKVFVTDSNACKNWSNAISLNWINNPDLKVIVNPENVCLGQAVSLDLYGAYKYLINYNTQSDSTILSFYQINGLSDTTVIYVKGVDSLGCFSEIALPVIIHPLPAKPIINGIGKVLYSSYINNNQWYFEDTKIEGATQSSYNPTQEGFYYVVHQDINGCESKSDGFLFQFVNLNSISSDKQLQLYPNPATNEVVLRHPYNGEVKIEIIDFNGKLVREQLSNQAMVKLDLSDLNSSNYLVKCSSINRIEWIKLSVVR
jgi:hypothetical protein